MPRTAEHRSSTVPALLMALLVASAAGCGRSSPVAPIVVPPLDSIRVTPDTLTLRVGGSGLFFAIGYDTTGAAVGNVPAAWSTDDTTGSIVTIDSRGRARAAGEGEARVYATIQGHRDSALVIVGPAQDGWYVQPSAASGADLHGVFFLPDGRTGWAVGAGGRVVHTANAGATWAPQISGTGFELRGVWFTSALEGWAVGLGGTALRTTNGGRSWARVELGTSAALHDVCFANAAQGSIVGAGVILTTFDGGGTWSLDFPTAAALHGVSYAGAHGWAVGAGGVIVGTHDFGTSWFVVQPFVTSETLNDVWRRSEGKAWAAGAVGVTPRTVPVSIAGPDTTGWELRNAGALFALEGVHFPSDVVGFAVGRQDVGAVIRTDDGGLTWRSQVSNSQFRLLDVYFVDERRGWAVGENGTIVHTGTGGDR